MELLLPVWKDLVAVVFFLGSWAIYARYADQAEHQSLLTVTNEYRLKWLQEMLKRENRTMDAIMVGNLQRSISFFANTTIFILLGLVTLLGYSEKASVIVSAIPFMEPTSLFMWEAKVFLLIIVFIYAFFKYTWSLRQYNYAGIYLASCPSCRERVEEHPAIAEKGAYLVANAAKHFNNGLRAYYFGLAALAWFVHPFALIAVTAWVLFVTHRREFRSGTLKNLTRPHG